MWWSCGESRYVFTAGSVFSPLYRVILTCNSGNFFSSLPPSLPSLPSLTPFSINILVALQRLAAMNSVKSPSLTFAHKSLWFLSCLRCAAFLYVYLRLAYWLPQSRPVCCRTRRKACRWTISLLTDQNVWHNHWWRCIRNVTLLEQLCTWRKSRNSGKLLSKKIGLICLCLQVTGARASSPCFGNNQTRILVRLLLHYWDLSTRDFQSTPLWNTVYDFIKCPPW